jgi:F420-non-reducing hydrogenase iron-sulfur subunit
VVAQEHVDFANRILEKRGFGKRVHMYYCSSAEGEKLVKSVEDSVEKIKRIGPNPIKAEKVSQQTS